MQYDHILIRYGEIALKGKNTKKFLKILQQNIEHKLSDFTGIQVKRVQGRLFILLNGHDPGPIIEICKKIVGIHSLSSAIRVNKEIDDIKSAALYALTSSTGKESFKVSVRRADKSFPHRSQEMNQMLGSHLLKNSSGFHVDVHEPDIEVKVEIREHGAYITSDTIKGLGGLPYGMSGKTLLLLSGGIDSPVAGYLLMKRGVRVDAIHFHSPPFTSERAKQKVLDLAKELTTYGKEINIHIVPFTKLQQKIFQEIPERYAMTVMRRVMVEISERVCKNEGILSMATGENLGQVASQTMESMNAINEVTTYPILRPLLTMDKDEIIQVAKQINTYPISIQPYEDCCTIFVPKSPKTNPKREIVHHLQSKVDFTELMQEAIEEIEVVQISDFDTTIENTFKELL